MNSCLYNFGRKASVGDLMGNISKGVMVRNLFEILLEGRIFDIGKGCKRRARVFSG